MDLNYAIFRSEPIITIYDLSQLGLHNKREKKVYQFNHDIKLELTKNNIELVPLDVKYVKGFDKIYEINNMEYAPIILYNLYLTDNDNNKLLGQLM